MLLKMAPRILKPMGRAADVRIYSDACTTDEGRAAFHLFKIPGGEKERQKTLTGKFVRNE